MGVRVKAMKEKEEKGREGEKKNFLSLEIRGIVKLDA